MTTPVLTPVELMERIDARYLESKKMNIPCTNPYWAVWSGQFNRELLNQIKLLGHKKAVLYKYVYAYWWNRTHLLDLFFKTNVGKVHEKKAMRKKATILRALIREENIRANADYILKTVDGFIEKFPDITKLLTPQVTKPAVPKRSSGETTDEDQVQTRHKKQGRKKRS